MPTTRFPLYYNFITSFRRRHIFDLSMNVLSMKGLKNMICDMRLLRFRSSYVSHWRKIAFQQSRHPIIITCGNMLTYLSLDHQNSSTRPIIGHSTLYKQLTAGGDKKSEIGIIKRCLYIWIFVSPTSRAFIVFFQFFKFLNLK